MVRAIGVALAFIAGLGSERPGRVAPAAAYEAVRATEGGALAYKVTMWHEGFRPRGIDRNGRRVYEPPHTLTRDVRIASNAPATVDFELK